MSINSSVQIWRNQQQQKPQTVPF